jgi:hypothetical protein
LSESWSQVRDDLDQLFAREADFRPDTVTNALAFLAFASSRYLPPDEVGKGYRPTVRLMWNVAKIEVEIYESRYEFYRFFDGRTDIEELDHMPSAPFPDRLTSLLDNSSLRL